MDYEVLKKQKSKLERKIKRNKDKIKDLENRIDKLSEHGHWMLGYLIGCNSACEEMLNEIEDMIFE